MIKNKFIILALGLLLPVASALMGAGVTNASPMPIPTTNTLSVISQNGSQNFSAAKGTQKDYKWLASNANDYGSTCAQYNNSIASIIGLDSGNYAVSQMIFNQANYNNSYSPNGARLGIYITYHESKTSTYRTERGETYAFARQSSSQYYSAKFIYIAIANDGSYYRYCGDSNSSSPAPVNTDAFAYASNSDEIKMSVYFSTFGYGGTDGVDNNIPTTPPNPIVKSDAVPNWYISSIIAGKGSFHDTHFNTFDGNPFLCEDDLAPAYTAQIKRLTGNPELGDLIVYSTTQSATAEINFDFGKAEIDRDYQIIGQYNCGDDSSLQFDQYGVAEFTVTKDGNLKMDLFDSCIDKDFPFVHPEGCANNLASVINLLYFGEIRFPSWTFDPNCKQLHTFANWMHLQDGYQICPAIPAQVRNITTPFVAFMLGLITLRFIQRRSGDFNG